MAWLDNLDAKCKASDRRWDAWLDRHLSPAFDWVIAYFPLLAWGLIGLRFLTG